METGWGKSADLDLLGRAEQVLSLHPEFIRRAKLDAYRRAHVEATADHDLTVAEEAALERARTAFGLSDRSDRPKPAPSRRERRVIRRTAA